MGKKTLGWEVAVSGRRPLNAIENRVEAFALATVAPGRPPVSAPRRRVTGGKQGCRLPLLRRPSSRLGAWGRSTRSHTRASTRLGAATRPRQHERARVVFRLSAIEAL